MSSLCSFDNEINVINEFNDFNELEDERSVLVPERLFNVLRDEGIGLRELIVEFP